MANITDASFVWVLAHKEDLENQWWPQDEPKVAGSEWKTVAYIGVKRDIGHDFEIAVATFGKDAKKAIDEYFEIAKDIGKYLPISFPDATSNIEIVTVKKVAH